MPLVVGVQRPVRGKDAAGVGSTEPAKSGGGGFATAGAGKRSARMRAYVRDSRGPPRSAQHSLRGVGLTDAASGRAARPDGTGWISSNPPS
jgi:hypothetical protein